MKFDFTTVWDRQGKDAMAVESVGGTGHGVPSAPKEGFDLIPMWIADMGFATAPAVTEAIRSRLDHPLFGYFKPRKEYYDRIISWQERRNGVEGLQPSEIAYENGVLGGVVTALDVFCGRGGSVLVQSPTYIGFTRALQTNGFNIVPTELRLDGEGVWRLDFEAIERAIIRNKIHAAVVCSPHNPTGRVWERWELERLAGIFEQYAVNVVSDEIWSDLVLRGHHHIPFQNVSDYARTHTVALYAPSKTFNLAGLVGSYRIVRDGALHDRIAKEADRSKRNSMNVLSMHALIGAYSEEGESWLEELLDVLDRNARYAVDFIRENFPGVRVARPQGTYMLFVDIAGWCAARHMTLDEVYKAGCDVGVAWQDGRPFHGPCCLRVNLALPFERVAEAMARLKKHVFN